MSADPSQNVPTADGVDKNDQANRSSSKSAVEEAAKTERLLSLLTSAAIGLDDEEAREATPLLLANGYKTEQRLFQSTREGLAGAGITHGIIDAILAWNGKPPADEEDPADEVMKNVMSNWHQLRNGGLFLSRKRTVDATSINSTEDDNSAKVRRVEEKCSETLEEDQEVMEVEIMQPSVGLSWYCGGGNEDPLYVRKSIKDVGSVVMDHILESEKKKHSIVYVISGAAGIGKSWSINAFVLALLGHDMKVFFHSGSTGEAWYITNDRPPKKAPPATPPKTTTRRAAPPSVSPPKRWRNSRWPPSSPTKRAAARPSAAS